MQEMQLIEQFKRSASKSPAPSFTKGAENGNLQESVDSMKSFSDGLFKKFEKYVGDMEDNWTRSCTIMCMESWERATKYLDEATKAAAITNFNKNAFPLIRAVLPATATEKVFSVQPMLGPTSQIFVLQPVYGTTTSKVNAGDPLWKNHDPNYGDSVIEDEELAIGDGTTKTKGTVTLPFLPVVRGSLNIEAEGATCSDDGNGVIIGDASGTINYSTGALALNWTTAPADGVPVVGRWSVDNETDADAIPDIDLLLTSYPVTARRKAIKFRFSLIAQFALRDQYGVEAEAELIKATGAEIAYGIDTQNFRVVVGSAINKTEDTAFTFDATYLGGASNISRKELYEGFIYNLIQGSTEILTQSGRAVGNFLLVPPLVGNILQTIGLPRFESYPMQATRGIQLIGKLDGRWDIFQTVNPEYLKLKTNHYLIGCKNEDFLQAGYVWAPWIAAFETPTTTLDDFQARKGMASLSGHRLIDAKFFLKAAVKGLS